MVHTRIGFLLLPGQATALTVSEDNTGFVLAFELRALIVLYEEVKTKQDLSYVSICSLRILYNSKYILMATSLGTNAVVVTMVQCIININQALFFLLEMDRSK